MDDLISRQAAIDALMELVEARREWKSDASGEIKGLNAAYCAIEDLPSVPQNLQPTCNQLATNLQPIALAERRRLMRLNPQRGKTLLGGMTCKTSDLIGV